MAQVKPNDFVLRCYGHRKKNGCWYGKCLDLNLSAEADTLDELKKKLHDVIESYVDLVVDTNDTDSIPVLMSRRAPFFDWLNYSLIKCTISIKHIKNNLTFKTFIPFRLNKCNC